jgi:hypothetical protein
MEKSLGSVIVDIDTVWKTNFITRSKEEINKLLHNTKNIAV